MGTCTMPPVLRAGTAVVGALVLGFGGIATANAHVGISAESAAAGSYAVLTFSIPHGCDGSPTTRVAIRIPEEIDSVTPTRNPFYTLETVTAEPEAPVTDSHGNEVAERVAEVIYTATTPLPADQRDTLELSLRLPEDAAGETLYFPTVQTCEQGEAAWVQIPAEGQDPHDLELPAPGIAVVAADAHHEHGASPDSEEIAPADDHAPEVSNPWTLAALFMGALGLIAGAAALLRGRRPA